MEYKIEKDKEGCPCGMSGKCCEEPEITSGEHECDDKCELICEDTFQLVCLKCGASCYHEL